MCVITNQLISYLIPFYDVIKSTVIVKRNGQHQSDFTGIQLVFILKQGTTYIVDKNFGVY